MLGNVPRADYVQVAALPHLLKERRGIGIYRWRFSIKDDFACQFLLPRLELFFFLSRGTAITSAVTVPWVAGDQGVACAIKTAVSGVTMSTAVLSCRQPKPKSPQPSRCGLAQPMAVSWSRVHAFALAKFGEPVSRAQCHQITRSRTP